MELHAPKASVDLRNLRARTSAFFRDGMHKYSIAGMHAHTVDTLALFTNRQLQHPISGKLLWPRAPIGTRYSCKCGIQHMKRAEQRVSGHMHHATKSTQFSPRCTTLQKCNAEALPEVHRPIRHFPLQHFLLELHLLPTRRQAVRIRVRFVGSRGEKHSKCVPDGRATQI